MRKLLTNLKKTESYTENVKICKQFNTKALLEMVLPKR